MSELIKFCLEVGRAKAAQACCQGTGGGASLRPRSPCMRESLLTDRACSNEYLLQEAKIHPSHVRFVEAHATGTSVGDIIGESASMHVPRSVSRPGGMHLLMMTLVPAELDGLARVFASHHHSELNPLLVASIKGNIG